MMATQPKKYIQLIDDCDNFPYPDQGAEYTLNVTRVYRFCLKQKWEPSCTDLVTVGYIMPAVAHTMPWITEFKVDNEERTVMIEYGTGENYESNAIKRQLIKARELGIFEILQGWRDEEYSVFGVDRSVLIERSGSGLFGILTAGVHMTAYQKTSDGEIKIWVPRRAYNKTTYGGMLDNTVAGGLAAGEDPFDCVMREAAEEASLPEDLLRRDIVAVGTISYFHIRGSRAGGETGLFQPEIQYVYDIEVGSDVQPRPSDGEVHEFYLWDVHEVIAAMKQGQFKPNCALCLIDFLVRHGIITGKNEPDFCEIIPRLHRRLHF